jgi:preprotein translocase subunit SecF
MELFRKTNIDFIGFRKYTYIFSAATTMISLIWLLVFGFKYGIDFTGGTSIELKFSNKISVGDIRDAVSKLGFGDSEIKQVGLPEANSYLIRVGLKEEGVQVSDLVQTELTKNFPNNPYELLSVTQIGPKIGGELRRGALMSILVALIGLLIYIAWRFDSKFAVGGVIATFHDVIFVLGVFTILGMEMSLTVLAAILTIVGYSINDTIVVFDRIRENLKIHRRDDLRTVMNLSMNQTLSRTLLTGVSTLVVLIILYFMGGQVIHDFAFTLFIGTVIGTYSSIYVASTIVLDWNAYLENRKRKKIATRTA